MTSDYPLSRPPGTAKSRVDEFLELYNQLDSHIRRRLNADAQRSHARLLEEMAERDVVFREHHSRLQAYRALRNSIVHLPSGQEGGEPIADPRQSVIDDYRNLVAYILNPPTALESIATRHVFSAGWGSRVIDALEIVQSRGFDTVPILEADRIEGLYTEQCLQRMCVKQLRAGRALTLGPDSTFRELQSECGFSEEDPTNEADHPPLVRFAPSTISVEELEELFRREARRMRFIAVVCLTHSGRAFEPLDGLVTPHNLPSANGYSEKLLEARSAIRRGQ